MAEKPFGKSGQWLKGLVQWEGQGNQGEHKSQILYSYFDLNKIAGIRRDGANNYLLWLGSGTTVYVTDCTWVTDLTAIAPTEE